MPHEHARRPNGRVILPGSLAAIAAKYFGAKDFQRLDATSQSNRRNIIESCLQEKIRQRTSSATCRPNCSAAAI